MKTTAVALTGAVVLSSGAYALGTQSGGGDASAAKAENGTAAAYKRFALRRAFRHGPFQRGQELQSLATKLGVTTTQLQDALQALRTQKRDDMAQKLADALGIDVSKVTSALDALRPPGPPAGAQGYGPPPGAPGPGDAGPPGPPHHRLDFLAQALADKLGLKQSDVQAALDKLSPADIKAAGSPAAAIAKALGVDESKVRDALKSLRPAGGPGGPGGPGRPFGRGRGFGGPGLSALATKLGVTTAQLQDAFQKLESGERDAFAAALAGKLGIDVQKVKDALPAKGPFGGHGP